jgi:hypothetical protein
MRTPPSPSPIPLLIHPAAKGEVPTTTKIIVSSHDYQQTASEADLQALVEASSALRSWALCAALLLPHCVALQLLLPACCVRPPTTTAMFVTHCPPSSG